MRKKHTNIGSASSIASSRLLCIFHYLRPISVLLVVSWHRFPSLNWFLAFSIFCVCQVLFLSRGPIRSPLIVLFKCRTPRLFYNKPCLLCSSSTSASIPFFSGSVLFNYFFYFLQWMILILLPTVTLSPQWQLFPWRQRSVWLTHSSTSSGAFTFIFPRPRSLFSRLKLVKLLWR